MPTEDAYSSGHLVLSHFGTCMCSYVETNLSRTCLVSGLLNFEHPSILLFCSSSILLIQCSYTIKQIKYDRRLLHCQRIKFSIQIAPISRKRGENLYSSKKFCTTYTIFFVFMAVGCTASYFVQII